MLNFVLGLVIGVVIGIVIMGLLAFASDNDRMLP